MDTPICDFVRRYAESGVSRLHMPGHKGSSFLGCEEWDVTEISGADSLYEASGIIAASENNAAALFGSARTLYSAEGSSQCVRAMLYLALLNAPQNGKRPFVLAARNAHKSFVLGAALLDLDVEWLWPGGENFSLCSCGVSPQGLEKTLDSMSDKPAAVYITSPDYLGGMLDVGAIADACHRHGVPLLVDNAHGAYLHFLPRRAHPLDLGADMCCDSAHKTLPVLTGGAYLHISKTAPEVFSENARRAMALFGSTSPSYLILQSLDIANAYIAGDYAARLAKCAEHIDGVKAELGANGWEVYQSDPLKITVGTAGRTEYAAGLLRRNGVEFEYADPDYIVMMATPENREEDFTRILSALGCPPPVKSAAVQRPRLPMPQRRMSIRRAVLSPQENVAAEEAAGRILASPAVSCPPAVSVLVSGEEISREAVEIMAYYGARSISVVRD